MRRGPGLGHAIGARLVVTAGDRTQRREIRPQQSYLCSGDPRAFFGLGPAPRVDRLEVHWLDGTSTVLTDENLERVYRVTSHHGSADGVGYVVPWSRVG